MALRASIKTKLMSGAGRCPAPDIRIILTHVRRTITNNLTPETGKKIGVTEVVRGTVIDMGG